MHVIINCNFSFCLLYQLMFILKSVIGERFNMKTVDMKCLWLWKLRSVYLISLIVILIFIFTICRWLIPWQDHQHCPQKFLHWVDCGLVCQTHVYYLIEKQHTEYVHVVNLVTVINQSGDQQHWLKAADRYGDRTVTKLTYLSFSCTWFTLYANTLILQSLLKVS